MKPDARTAVLDEQRSPVPHEADRHEPGIPARERPFRQDDPPRSASPLPLVRPRSRRSFLKTVVISLGALALRIMDRIAHSAESIPEESETTLTVPWNAAREIHFSDPMIIVSRADRVVVFSSKCPHLGCRINRTEDREIVCPCHGSRFDLQGNVAHGPATRGLHSLPFGLDRARGLLHVTLEGSRT
jgi:cytochrome b6-f complex iron-sulfur subunit